MAGDAEPATLSRRRLKALSVLARGPVSEDDARAIGVRWRDLAALERHGLARPTDAEVNGWAVRRWRITEAGREEQRAGAARPCDTDHTPARLPNH